MLGVFVRGKQYSLALVGFPQTFLTQSCDVNNGPYVILALKGDGFGRQILGIPELSSGVLSYLSLEGSDVQC